MNETEVNALLREVVETVRSTLRVADVQLRSKDTAVGVNSEGVALWCVMPSLKWEGQTYTVEYKNKEAPSIFTQPDAFSDFLYDLVGEPHPFFTPSFLAITLRYAGGFRCVLKDEITTFSLYVTSGLYDKAREVLFPD